MAEEKEYLDIQEEGGAIKVSFAAVGEIAAQAALAVPGVAALATVPQSAVKGVTVTTSEIGICSVDVHILSAMGNVIAQVAKDVQRAVKTAVDAAIGIEVASVNVYVAGVAAK